MRNDLVGESIQLLIERLKLEHEQFDTGVMERFDALDHLVVAADQARECAAVGPNTAGAGRTLYIWVLGSVPDEISGRCSASTNDCRWASSAVAFVSVSPRNDEGRQAEPQRSAVA